jgi:adenylate cyclase
MKSSSNQKQSTKPVRSNFSTSKGIKLQQVEILLNISKKMAAVETLDEVLETLVNVTISELNADRGTIFLNDNKTGELYSRIALGNIEREIRIMNDSGVAGYVFTTGKSLIIHDVYTDDRFNRTFDEQTGYVTKSILCAPIKTVNGKIIGAAQALNKKKGRFTKKDMLLLEAMTMQAAISLQSTQFVERMKRSRLQEMEYFDVVSDLISEIDLGVLLQKVMAEATKILNCERSTLFINDEKTNELFSQVGEGLGATQIRFPNHLGIAGTVFTSGESINIPHAYADLKFNPDFDKKTGFFTRSILCVPVINKDGKTIGVTQALNKHGGPFLDEDESRLKAFTAQISIALENAKLFDDVQNMKNYSESMLESMSNGVITLDEEGEIITCNAAGLSIMKISEEDIIGRHSTDFFTGANAWVLERIQRVDETQESDITMDADFEFGGEELSVNLTVLPLISVDQKKLGSMIMIEDISSEKRIKSTMSRYIDPALADQLMEKDKDILGGKSTTATMLFSDVRDFTTLTEELGAHGTVSLLNEYFTIMVECIQREGGMLDKFIGDAIMAAFGMPIAHDDDEDRGVRVAISMMTELNEWNAKRLADGKKPVNIGIGINTDVVVSGNIGSPKRMDFTLIGDGVNLAARLESACKQYFANILISDNTYKKLKGTYRIREIDRVVVKGKTKAVGIYEVLDYHNDETFPNVMSAVDHFNHGIKLYREGKWDKSIEAFKETLNLNQEDNLSKMYIERCTNLKENPPGDDWDGVWRMSTK